jgi:four helix bundle protein
MGSINSYKDLLIWQKDIVLVVRVSQLVKSFPQEELYALTSQIKRASVPIPSNISEGYGRNTDKSISYFLDISRGSLNELETQLIIANELGFVVDLKLYEEIMVLIEE